MRRRRFLKLLAASLPATRPLSARGARGVAALPPVPRVNGGINVQPLRRLERGPGPAFEPVLVALQMRAVYELGFQQLRITLPFARFAPDFFAAIPYVRAARALGIDVVGVLSDFTGYALVQALALQRSAAAVLNTYRDIFVLPAIEPAAPSIAKAGDFSLQVLNEPVRFLGIAAEEYVREFLRPVNAFFKLHSPELLVVSAAEVGNVDGIFRARAMLEAGLEAHCDRVAYHVYSRRLLPLLADLAPRKPVWITESGADGTAGHLAWVRDVFPELQSRIAGVERILFYVLFDLDPGRFRLLDIASDASSFRARAESQDLIGYLQARVARVAAGQPTAAYDDLIPDITAYFPTPFDFDRVVEATPFLPAP